MCSAMRFECKLIPGIIIDPGAAAAQPAEPDGLGAQTGQIGPFVPDGRRIFHMSPKDRCAEVMML